MIGRRPAEVSQVELREFQGAIEGAYGERDRARGIAPTIAWIAEEVGELAQAVRKGSREQQVHELGDVLAWTASLASQLGIILDDCAARFADGCPHCHRAPCECA
jgi:NTP pyrophosphatase (non-canonical NTP hydrolase)